MLDPIEDPDAANNRTNSLTQPKHHLAHSGSQPFVPHILHAQYICSAIRAHPPPHHTASGTD